MPRRSILQSGYVKWVFFFCLFVSSLHVRLVRVSSLDFVTPRPQTALHSESNGRRGSFWGGKRLEVLRLTLMIGILLAKTRLLGEDGGKKTSLPLPSPQRHFLINAARSPGFNRDNLTAPTLSYCTAVGCWGCNSRIFAQPVWVCFPPHASRTSPQMLSYIYIFMCGYIVSFFLAFILLFTVVISTFPQHWNNKLFYSFLF